MVEQLQHKYGTKKVPTAKHSAQFIQDSALRGLGGGEGGLQTQLQD